MVSTSRPVAHGAGTLTLKSSPELPYSRAQTWEEEGGGGRRREEEGGGGRRREEKGGEGRRREEEGGEVRIQVYVTGLENPSTHI